MRILCYGDSNTFGYDPHCWWGDAYASGGWPDLLMAETGWEIVNCGQNGRQIPHLSHQLRGARRHLEENRPFDLLIVMLGTNDLLQGTSAIQTGQRMERFLRELTLPGSELLLLAPPPMKRGDWVTGDTLVAESRRLSGVLCSLAARLGIAFLDPGVWAPELAFDGVHLTQEAHKTFARELGWYLRKLFPKAGEATPLTRVQDITHCNFPHK